MKQNCKIKLLSLFRNSHVEVFCNFIKIETLGQVFFCEFCKIFKNTFFIEHLRVTTSTYCEMISEY